ncbi:helix-turn-helix domain-containing protein [Enterococcus plantarum]|uniref:helix-turn-helix domain-containing protein n=1 Tax=Enterococcus plantarum TaxID=1077675 RepID=UPI001A8DED78|nr:HTH domain-containing protein [Enterococcus plantarum]MBO0421452.1 HTH domain-containing protein [Enterococcus plantarum]
MNDAPRIIPHNPIYIVKGKECGFDFINHEEMKRRNKIKKGMQKSINKMGRPTKINDETLKKSYGKWLSGTITQKEIAGILGVSERTISRKFKKLREIPKY